MVLTDATGQNTPSLGSTPRYAIVFKTHSWDPFIERQFRRFQQNAPGAHLVVLLDETNRSLGDIPHPHVLRTTNAGLLAMGLADAFPKGGLIWWNTDYPNYFAARALPDFDYYLFVEYDSCMTMDIDAFVRDAAAREADMVALPTRQEKASWYWTKFHQRTYAYDDIRGSLNCISLFSARAMAMLLERRQEMTRELAAGRVGFWPGNEVFLPTEIHRAGYTFISLEAFGDASHFEWHPPILEDDLAQHDGRVGFLHPVLDRPRYIASVLKFEFDLSSYFDKRSNLRRTLSRFPAKDYVKLMPGAFRRQVMVKVRQGLGAV